MFVLRFFFLIIGLPPISTRIDTLCPHTTRFRSFRFSVERALAAPLPEHEPVAVLARLGGQFEQRAVEGGAIVVGQLDQAGFLDQAAQLYEVAGDRKSTRLNSSH